MSKPSLEGRDSQWKGKGRRKRRHLPQSDCHRRRSPGIHALPGTWGWRGIRGLLTAKPSPRLTIGQIPSTHFSVESIFHRSSTEHGAHGAARGMCARGRPLCQTHAPGTLFRHLGLLFLCPLWFDTEQRDAQMYTGASGGGSGERRELGMGLWMISLFPSLRWRTWGAP